MAATPKKQGGASSKPAPKYDKNGKRIFNIGITSTVTKQKKMPELRKSGGVGGPAVLPKSTTKAGPSIASKIAKRVGTTAREARDVVTSVSSAGKAVALTAAKGGKTTGAALKAIKDVGTQVKETAVAAKTGKKGTEAATVKKSKIIYGDAGKTPPKYTGAYVRKGNQR
jgi:hypothetical protein